MSRRRTSGTAAAGRRVLRARQRFGKYVIERRLAEGGFAVVYQARDTIEGIKVALKIPYDHLMTGATLEYLRREIRMVAGLDHPNILPLKYADHIEDHLVLVTPLAEESLDERLKRRLSMNTAVDYARQMIEAVAHAHENRIIHCDIKPDNFLLFPDNRLRLADFGIARVAHRTVEGAGTGTVGYVAPEQAMGKPSFRSDVFALGVILYRMFSGELPEWPYEWPMPGNARIRSRLHPDFVDLIRKSLEVHARKRYVDAQQMLRVFERIRYPLKRAGKEVSFSAKPAGTQRGWRSMRRGEFRRIYGKELGTRHDCAGCGEPVAEAMRVCPWCGIERDVHHGPTTFPAQCPRCHRGVKADWRYCAWCYGPGFEDVPNREYPDKRYVGRCRNPKCTRKQLMPFMRYCPWCNRKVKKRWPIEGSRASCSRCGCGIIKQYWTYCPWCGDPIHG